MRSSWVGLNAEWMAKRKAWFVFLDGASGEACLFFFQKIVTHMSSNDQLDLYDDIYWLGLNIFSIVAEHPCSLQLILLETDFIVLPKILVLSFCISDSAILFFGLSSIPKQHLENVFMAPYFYHMIWFYGFCWNKAYLRKIRCLKRCI